MEALIFNIQRFSTKDGPGIRTTVFFKGCNVNCLWCHNPESIEGIPVLRFEYRCCVNCGRCADVCQTGATYVDRGKRFYNPDKCTLCGDCTEVCGAHALEIIGKNYTVQELYNLLLKDEDFYKESGGGITFSGGEPLLQQEFLIGMLKRLKKSGIHTAIDTALNVDWEQIESVLPWTDLILLDIKGMEPKLHLKNTGVGPALIHQNAEKLAAENNEIIVRLPLVRGVNDSIEELTAAAEFIKDWPQLCGVELLPYHSLGAEKSYEYASLKVQEKFDAPSKEHISAVKNLFKERGIKIL